MTMVERKSLFTVVKRIEIKHADITADALIASIMPIKATVCAITLGNGKGFTQHERIGNTLKVFVYFAHPYSFGSEG